MTTIQTNISELGYRKEYIEKHKLNETKSFHWGSSISGVECYFEPLEVKIEGGVVYYRENEDHVHMDAPEVFATQYGYFNNHNNGEFVSWLGKDNNKRLPEKEKKINSYYGFDDFFIEGNYCDMFDCGDYSYAVSNLMHMSIGWFKIVRIDKQLDTAILYDNSREVGWNCLEYLGRFENDQGYMIITSGFTRNNPEADFQDRTVLFQIDKKGNCQIEREWGFIISHSNSLVVIGDYVYFGQNKMITRLNIVTGAITYFTNKTDEELAALEYRKI